MLRQVRLGEWQPTLYGNYTCLAKNLHGYTSKNVRLREACEYIDYRDLPVLTLCGTVSEILLRLSTILIGLALTVLELWGFEI